MESALSLFADASDAVYVMRSYIMPIVATLGALAGLACTFFLVQGGIQYMTSSGDPEKLQYAKKVIKNALLGLVIVLAAVTLTTILSNAYSGTTKPLGTDLPLIQEVDNGESLGIADVILKAILAVLKKLIESVGASFINALAYFTESTPLMGDNASVFNLWVVSVGIADVLFILVVALLGFHVMSAASLGFEELDVKQLLPRLAIGFLLINTSIFLIDGVISFSNMMIEAFRDGVGSSPIWQPLIEVSIKRPLLSFAASLIYVSFIVVSVMLLIYYVLRLIVLYLGAVLAPLIILFSLLPAFRDFAHTALKTYLVTIFVLPVHIVILLLASSIFQAASDRNGEPNTLMALLVGLATLLALLKTQQIMQELAQSANTPRAARNVAGAFIKGVSYTTAAARMAQSGNKGKTRDPDQNGQGSGGSTTNNNNQKNKTRNTPAPASYLGPRPKKGETRTAPKQQEVKEPTPRDKEKEK